MADYNSTYTGAQIDAGIAAANTATQPGDLATVATTGAYADLTGLPTLGTAAATASTDYATAAQGALADTAVQPGDQLTSAFTSTVDDDGKKSIGTYTPSTAVGSNYKKIVNGGAFTLAPVAMATGAATTLSVLIVNDASAGAITTSGFTKVTGDAFTTTDGEKFLCRIEVFDIAGVEYSFLNVVALQ